MIPRALGAVDASQTCSAPRVLGSAFTHRRWISDALCSHYTRGPAGGTSLSSRSSVCPRVVEALCVGVNYHCPCAFSTNRTIGPREAIPGDLSLFPACLPGRRPSAVRARRYAPCARSAEDAPRPGAGRDQGTCELVVKPGCRERRMRCELEGESSRQRARASRSRPVGTRAGLEVIEGTRQRAGRGSGDP